MTSKVYFMDLRATPRENLFRKLKRLMRKAKMTDHFKERELVAVKIHFGELGNAAFIRPVFIRQIVEFIKQNKAKPFLTDANTLYAGYRGDSPTHLTTAIQNGFAYSVVEAPLVIADGLRGRSEKAITINRKRYQEVYIGTEVAEADSLISVAHFKGHELSGFGGAIKNIGMGCASRRGKLAQHSTVSPRVIEKKCVGCEECASRCSGDAIMVVEKKAKIDADNCIGCGECILICPNSAIEIQWDQAVPVFLENMVEYTEGVMKTKKDKMFCINFITDVSPECDCLPSNDAPIVRDIGVLASSDPVAIDQASVDMINREPSLPGSRLKDSVKAGEDKIKAIWPKVDWPIQLEYAEELGLGSRTYELVKI